MTARGKLPPQHLKPATRRWWSSVVRDYEMSPHHVRLLTLAGEAWDRCVEAREALAEHGFVFTDRFNCPKSRPEVAIERDSRLGFARMLREMALDDTESPETRPPRIPGRYERTH
jgi:phage terminase small subunit